jgi:hypothetical protein
MRIKNQHPLYTLNKMVVLPAAFGIAKKLGATEQEVKVSEDILETIWSGVTGDPIGVYNNAMKAKEDAQGSATSREIMSNSTGDPSHTLKLVKDVKEHVKKEKEVKASKNSAYGQYTTLNEQERQGFTVQDFKEHHKPGKDPKQTA